MTVSSTTARVTYTGDGATKAFAYPFRIFLVTDIAVWKRTAAGVLSQLTLATDYTVTGLEAVLGGTVTMVVAPALNDTITLLPAYPLTQVEVVRAFSEASVDANVELSRDRSVLLGQQLQEQISRSIQIPPDEAGVAATVRLPSVVARLGRLLGFSSTGAVAVLGAAGVDAATYGATGDGTTDDTAALNAALTAVAAMGAAGHGGRLQLGPGTFIVNATLVIPNGVQVVGFGKRATVIKAKASAFTGAYVVQLGAGSSSVFDVFCEDLTIDGASIAPISGVNVNHAQEGCGLRSCVVTGFTSKGIDLSGNTSANTFFQDIEMYASASASGTVIGIDINTPNTYIAKATVSCLGMTSVVTKGINITQSNTTLANIHIEGCASGIFISGNSNSTFGFTIEATTSGVVRPVTTLIDDQSTSFNVFFNVVKNAATTTWAQSVYGTTSVSPIITSTLGASAAPKVATAASAGASPYQYHNTSETNQVVTISGGTVSAISIARQGVNSGALATTTSLVYLAPGDILNITHTGAPTLTTYPNG